MIRRAITLALVAAFVCVGVSGLRGEDAPAPAADGGTNDSRTLTCVKSYGTYSTPRLNTSNVMTSWKDKNGYLYLALKADSEKKEDKVSYRGGGIAIVAPDNKVLTLTGDSRPCFPADTIIHAWGDDEGKIYVSTCYHGLVVIDTKNTPMDPTDDTATKYCTEGVFDTTEGGTPKLIGHSPCLGCDLVLHSCMDPETRDLFICAGNYYMQKERPDTYEGGFITLQWDKEKKAYNKAYIYRALHWQITRVKQKSYRRGIYDTTEAYNVERKKFSSGKRIQQLLSFGANQNCHVSCYDAKRGIIYVGRSDTLAADYEAIPGYNSDGGLTIIKTKKTRDPSDDFVYEINLNGKPTVCGTFVSHVRVDETDGNAFVSALALVNLNRGGVTVLSDAIRKSTSFLAAGIYDTSQTATGMPIDKKNRLKSPSVHLTVAYPPTGETLVVHAEGIDIISKDLKKVTSIPLTSIKKMPNDFGEEGMWATHAWVDKDGLIYLATGEGKNGLLVLKLAE